MIETITLITLCMLYLIFFRPGKTPPLENPLVIQRPGQYHLTLASHLNLAQPFIEGITARVAASEDMPKNTETVFFEVRDNQVTAHGFDYYLLAVTVINGMLFIQAAKPRSDDAAANFIIIRDAAHEVLARYPDDEVHEPGEKLVDAVQYVAGQRGNQVKVLTV